jgi:hypothetical protein
MCVRNGMNDDEGCIIWDESNMRIKTNKTMCQEFITSESLSQDK